MKNKLFIGILVVIAIAIAAYYYGNPLTLVNVPLTSLQEELDVTTLDNGLTVTIKEMHALPLVTIQFWVHTGARNEPEEIKGIAHIFEHIWFKGTATQPVGSFHKRVEGLGGDLNAMTSYDWTMYFVEVPSDKFDEIFPYMVDLLLSPSFDPVEIDKELQVIIEEQRFSFNEPEKFIDDKFGLLLLDKHPYRHPIIGYKETILANTPETIKNFYKTWYVPNNMNIVIVGDVNKKQILGKVKEAFVDFKPSELPQLNFPKEEPITETRYDSSYKNIGYTYVAVGYTGPNSKDEDRYAMMLLNTIFSDGDSSRLQSIVKKQKNLIVKGTGFSAPLNDLGIFETVLTIEPEKAGAAKAEVLLQLNRFKTEHVTDEELERAKTTIKTDKIREQEQIFRVGMDAGQTWIDGDLDEYPKFLSKINAVTKEDIKHVANKYFTAYTMYELKPKL